jgi:hypothetical protein
VDYDLLGDAAKRGPQRSRRNPRVGAERPQQRFYRDFADSTGSSYANDAGFADFAGGFRLTKPRHSLKNFRPEPRHTTISCSPRPPRSSVCR